MQCCVSEGKYNYFMFMQLDCFPGSFMKVQIDERFREKEVIHSTIMLSRQISIKVVNFQPNRLRGKLLSSGQDFRKNFLCSKHVLKVYFKPSRKNSDFLFLPFPSEPLWLKIHHIKNCHPSKLT